MGRIRALKIGVEQLHPDDIQLRNAAYATDGVFQGRDEMAVVFALVHAGSLVGGDSEGPIVMHREGDDSLGGLRAK